MLISRRSLCRLLVLSGIAMVGRGRMLAAQSAPQPFVVVLDGLNPATPVDLLAALLEPILGAGIPVGFVVDLGRDPDAPVPEDTEIARYLVNLALVSPDLAEVIAWAPDIAAAAPYFQIRMAGRARRRLTTFLGLTNEPFLRGIAPLTIGGWDRDGAVALDGVRAAGFRASLLLSPTDRTARYGKCQRTTTCLRGSLHTGVAGPAGDIEALIEDAVAGGEMTVLAVSLADIDQAPAATLLRRGQRLADAVLGAVRSDRIFVALPRSHVSWFDTGTARLVGFRVATPPVASPEALSAHAAFLAALAAAGIGFSVAAGPAEPDTPADRIAYCASRGPALIRQRGALWPCVTEADALMVSGAEIVVHADAAFGSDMDQNGLLHLSESLGTRDTRDPVGLAAFGPTRDLVIAVSPAAYATAAGRSDLIRLLQGLGTAGPTRITNIADFATAVLPRDPVYQVMLSTRRDTAIGRPFAGRASAAVRAAFLDDAKVAWSYFERLHEAATGLCVATAFFDGEWSSYSRVLTMWDLGSLIQANIAAHELGLIDDRAYMARSKAYVRALPAEPIGGLILPSSEVSSNAHRSVTLDFNACDTGRLLIALRALNDHPLSKGLASDAVALWDLPDTIRKGVAQSITNGRFAPVYRSHCTHYLSRGYRLWGLAAASPYAAMQGASPTDARMNLLYEVAKIGALGAEPLLLEAVELGASAPTDYLADVLLTAQARAHAQSGGLFCVSEGPLDRAPWFTYQGFVVDDPIHPWAVRAEGDATAYQGQNVLHALRTVSTKAAFLWAAVRPGAYSQTLLDYVRTRARASEAGFSSGIYTATGAAMTNYSDINTNGIILQAIAYILRGRIAAQQR